MKSKLFGLLLFVFAAYLGFNFLLKTKYDKLRAEIPPFTENPVAQEDTDFLDTVKSSWEIKSQTAPDTVFAQIAEVNGLEESVDGVVHFHTHKIPAYSFINFGRNSRESAFAATQAVAFPVSKDNRIYAGAGFAYVRLTDTLVEVYEDTENGLSRTLYSKPVL